VWKKLVECVPNISEGRHESLISEIATAAQGHGRVLLDTKPDADQNRTVITLVGEPDALAEGVLALMRAAVERIDLRQHRGTHPRMGAVDVIPFVPVRGVTMPECVALSRRVAEEIADKLGVPVYLYEESARDETRRDLAAIRRGEFEGLAEKMKDPTWCPDLGSSHPHPSAGAVAVGAREFLIAFNVNLATPDLSVAKRVAAAVRFSSGGLRYVKALGFPLAERGAVQVSMNLTNFRRTPILRVLEMVRREAERCGVAVSGAEIVGTVPREALYEAAASSLQLLDFSPKLVLEERIEEVLGEDR
jgi:glutamate formiminotransferase